MCGDDVGQEVGPLPEWPVAAHSKAGLSSIVPPAAPRPAIADPLGGQAGRRRRRTPSRTTERSPPIANSPLARGGRVSRPLTTIRSAPAGRPPVLPSTACRGCRDRHAGPSSCRPALGPLAFGRRSFEVADVALRAAEDAAGRRRVRPAACGRRRRSSAAARRESRAFSGGTAESRPPAMICTGVSTCGRTSRSTASSVG